jgi:peptide/nickel transport system ATP-binding protein
MANQSLATPVASVAAAGDGRGPDVLRLENLTVYYDTPRGPVHAVEDVSFALHENERLGLAGESGSGKSSMALTIMRLLKPPARIVRQHLVRRGRSGDAAYERMKELRLAQIALVAQTMNSLNPVAHQRPDPRRPGRPRRA